MEERWRGAWPPEVPSPGNYLRDDNVSELITARGEEREECEREIKRERKGG